MKKILVLLLVLLMPCFAQAQAFQFSQRHFTPQRLNPALVGSSSNLHAMLNYRNQTTAADFSLLSTFVDLSYPILTQGGRLGGVGLFLLDDRAGNNGIFKTQEVGISTGINIATSAMSTFNLGISYSQQQRSFDLTGLSTGSQFVPDRGFDSGRASGENFSDLNTSLSRWSAGIYWQRLNANEDRVAYFGLSVFDINRASDAVISGDSRLQRSLVAELGFELGNTRDSRAWFESFTYGLGNNFIVQGGFAWSKTMQADQNLVLRARYSTEQLVMVGATIEKGAFAIGASYDIAVGKPAVSNQSAFEVGLSWKMPRKARSKKRKKKTTPKPAAQRELPIDTVSTPTPTPEPNPVLEQEVTPVDTATVSEPEEKTEMNIGPISGKKRVVSEFTSRLGFDFNSTQPGNALESLVDSLVVQLTENPGYTVEITGHTDSIGSDEVNQRISEQRAGVVAEALFARGISPEKVKVIGASSRLPVSSNQTAAGRALNRRVEIVILDGN